MSAKSSILDGSNFDSILLLDLFIDVFSSLPSNSSSSLSLLSESSVAELRKYEDF